MNKPFCVGGVEMDLPIIVGAGACKYLPQALKYMDPTAQVGAVTLGSITPGKSTGNEGTLFYPPDLGSFLREGVASNSFGMPNDGYESTARLLQQYSFCKPLVVSIAGDGVSDYVAGAEAFQDVECIAAIKANLGCPNKHEKRVVPIGHDFESLHQILEAFIRLQLKKPLWIKLSRYVTREWIEMVASKYPRLDFSHVPTVTMDFIDEVVKLIAKYRFVCAVVYGNTLPNVIWRDADGHPVTTPNGGKAGLSGEILRENTIAFIRRARSVLPESMSIIASGGITTGDHAAECLRNEADAVALTSLPFYADNDPRVFSSLIAGSDDLQYQLIRQES